VIEEQAKRYCDRLATLIQTERNGLWRFLLPRIGHGEGADRSVDYAVYLRLEKKIDRRSPFRDVSLSTYCAPNQPND
jgi:hypothetical protein